MARYLLVYYDENIRLLEKLQETIQSVELDIKMHLENDGI